jgi:hypothetical protein
MAADNSLTKRAHLKQQWTEQQVHDMMACMDPENGHIHFAKNFFYIQHPTKGKLLLEPFDYQLRLLDSYHKYTYSCNLIGRQQGKCLRGDNTMITIRNKLTGEEYELSIRDFYNMQSNTSGK